MVGFVINDEIKSLAQGENFATISTLLPSGQIQTHVVWVDCDDDHVVMNTEVELRKFKNVQADPRVTVTIWDRKIPNFFAEVRGHVVDGVTEPEARANIDAARQNMRPNGPEAQSPRPVGMQRVVATGDLTRSGHLVRSTRLPYGEWYGIKEDHHHLGR